MLRLPEKLPEPVWETYREAVGDDPAVRVLFAPISPAAVAVARRAIGAELRVSPGDVDSAGEAMSRALLQRGIIAWEGIGDSEGNVVEPTRDIVERDDDGNVVKDEHDKPVITRGTISLFLADQAAFDWADRVYVLPWVTRDAEKNGSSGSPAGTGQGATPEKDTANSVAQAKRRGATGARIPSTRRGRKKVKQPGK